MASDGGVAPDPTKGPGTPSLFNATAMPRGEIPAAKSRKMWCTISASSAFMRRSPYRFASGTTSKRPRSASPSNPWMPGRMREAPDTAPLSSLASQRRGGTAAAGPRLRPRASGRRSSGHRARHGSWGGLGALVSGRGGGLSSGIMTVAWSCCARPLQPQRALQRPSPDCWVCGDHRTRNAAGEKRPLFREMQDESCRASADSPVRHSSAERVDHRKGPPELRSVTVMSADNDERHMTHDSKTTVWRHVPSPNSKLRRASRC